MKRVRMPEGIVGKIKMLPKLAEMGAFFPKIVSKGPCQEVVKHDAFSLFDFPVLQCWPQDAGRFITLPLLMPVVLLVTVFSTISAYNVFTQIYVFASDIQGSPGSLARVLIYDIFENAFRFYRMGYASAEASVFFVLVLALTLVEFRVLRSQTEL